MPQNVYVNLKTLKTNITGDKQTAFDKIKTALGNGADSSCSAEAAGQATYDSRMNMLRVAVKDYLDPTAGMTDEQKERFVKKLYAKIQSGKKLTPDEMQYLRQYDPVTYMKVARVQAQREAFETQLKNCKSKEEAQDIYLDKVSRISEDDPARQELRAAYDDAFDEYKKSGDYKSLPNTEEERKRKRENNTKDGK